MQTPEDEIEYLRHANSSLRQSMDQLTTLHQVSLQISSARSIEQLFRVVALAIPTVLPVIAVEGIFRRPGSQTIFQLRHHFSHGSHLPNISEEALQWARERNAQTALPLSNGGVIFCPLTLLQLDLGHLLIYTTGEFESYNETVGIALDILSEQTATAVQNLWRQSQLEEDSGKLLSTKKLLDSILESVHQPVLALDASGHLLLANSSAAQLFGRNLGTLVGQHYQVVFPGEVADAISEQFLPVQKGKSGQRNHVRFHSFQGEIREAEFTASPLALHDSRSTGMVLMGRTI